MQKKTIPAQKAIAQTVHTSLRNIAQAIGDWPTRIWNAAGKNGLQVTGAPVYVYLGCGDDPDQEFELRMCLPVQDHSTYQGEFEKIELSEYNCIESLYIGTMPDLSEKGWGAFMAEAASQNIKLVGEAREVYIQWEDFNSPNNKVLLQMGCE